MNKIWTTLMLFSMIALLIFSPNLILDTMMTSAKNVVSLCIELLAIYSIWLGILEIVDKTGLSDKIASLLKTPIKKIFKISDIAQIKYISVNLSANLLGLGNAATPSGIKAIKEMDKDLPKTKFAMYMLLIVNATSLQFIPTTAISLRSSAGSLSASDIIIPCILTSICATVISVFLLFLYYKLKKGKI